MELQTLRQIVPGIVGRKSFVVMDKNGIQIAITSVFRPGVFFDDESFAKRLARLPNEISSKLISDYPLRFGAFAILSVPDVTLSLEDLSFALNVLHLDDLVVLSNTIGVYIGDERNNELYTALNKRNAVVYVHPAEPEAGNPLG